MLERHKEDPADQFLTTNQGVRINDNQNSLKAGDRGPTLLEDFIFREKMTHFDHERIPERIVHARAAAAHGYFQVYESMARYTKAHFLQDPSLKTPVFVRLSTVVGFRGSTDMPRDVRGFATKFYTEEGNYDLVGNNMPVFFIQDAMKFPDLVHAIKPEPQSEIPQASAAHDTFWDFVSLMPESMHMIMWVLSDRALPRSLRMMEGFGVHTFRLVNEKGKGTFVKFHWKPLLGVHSVTWDESQKISGFDPDYHRRDLWEAIENGDYPEWELGMQLIPEEDEHKFPFDLLDPTKLVPEETVPVVRVGKMTLDRNPDNYFAETEQVAYHPGHVVPGIDFTNDPLLQGRLFSYLDTQLKRLGGPNFHEIPINRPVCPVHNNQREGHMRQTINKAATSYEPNTISQGCPFQAKAMQGGFTTYTERVDASKIRARSESFRDHFSQATLFYHSQTDYEKKHIIDAFRFELGKVKSEKIRFRIVGFLTQVDNELAAQVAQGLGLPVPDKPEEPMNLSFGADEDPKDHQPIRIEQALKRSEALSMANTVKDTIKTRKIAILAADGVDSKSLIGMQNELSSGGAMPKIISTRSGMLTDSDGVEHKIEFSFLTTSSCLYDAVYIPAGEKSVMTLQADADALHFIDEAYRHCKAIAADKEAIDVIQNTYAGRKAFTGDPSDSDLEAMGLIVSKKKGAIKAKPFIKAIANHRFWDREMERKVPA